MPRNKNGIGVMGVSYTTWLLASSTARKHPHMGPHGLAARKNWWDYSGASRRNPGRAAGEGLNCEWPSCSPSVVTLGSAGPSSVQFVGHEFDGGPVLRISRTVFVSQMALQMKLVHLFLQ